MNRLMHKTEYTDLNISVRDKFTELKENYSAVNSIAFMNYFRHLPKKVMLENISYLYEMNSNTGIVFLNQLIKSSDWDDNKLTECKNNIISYMNTVNNTQLSETVELIDSLIEENSSMENVRNEVLFNLYNDRFRSYCVFESYLHNELDIVIYNINYSPETIYDLEQIVRKIKTEELSNIISSFPKLLTKSTQMIQSISILLTGDVLDLVVSIPTAIANRLDDNSVDKAQIKLYIKMIDKELASINKTIKGDGKPQLYNMYSAYIRSLINAKKILTKRTTTKTVIESITEMQPDIVYSESVLDDLCGEIEELSTMLIFDDKEEINMESFDRLVRLSKTYSCLYEKTNAVIKAANRVGDTNRNLTNKIVSKSKDMKRTKTAINKSFEPLVNMFNNTINKIKEADKKDRTEQIITGQYKFKLTRVIRKGILTVAGAGVGLGAVKVGSKVAVGGIKALSSVVNPVLVAIGILTAVAVDKKINEKHRKAVLNDLEAELRIVNEKLEDAKSDGDREAKYELMRIQNKLKKDIERIKFGLKE